MVRFYLVRSRGLSNFMARLCNTNYNSNTVSLMYSNNRRAILPLSHVGAEPTLQASVCDVTDDVYVTDDATS